MKKKSLLDLLARGELRKIIEILCNDPSLPDESLIHQISGRLTYLEKEDNNGTIKSEDKLLERNKIINSIQNIINTFPDAPPIVIQDKPRAVISTERIELLNEKTPEYLQNIEQKLKSQQEFWAKVNLKRPKNSQALTLYYCRTLHNLISFSKNNLIENKPEFAGYKERVFSAIKVLIPIFETLEQLFIDYDNQLISSKTYGLKYQLEQIRLNLFSLSEVKHYKNFYALEILTIISELSTIETLLRNIYENQQNYNQN